MSHLQVLGVAQGLVYALIWLTYFLVVYRPRTAPVTHNIKPNYLSPSRKVTFLEGERVVWTLDPSGSARKGLGNNLARKCPMVFKFCKLHFQIFNVIGQVLLQFSNFLCSTVYSLPVIRRTQTLVAWNAFFSSSTPTATLQHSRHFRAVSLDLGTKPV